MAKFKKRPVVIEAVAAGGEFEIETPEGTMQVRRGDIVITGTSGETYPCRLDIFLQTYDVLDAEGQQVIDYAMKMASPEVVKAIEQDTTVQAPPFKK